MSGIAVCRLEEVGTEACETFLAGRPGATVYHSVRYARFLETLLGARVEYRVAVRDGAAVGVLPLMSRDGPFGTVLNSMPFFGSYGGVIAADEAAAAALWAAYRRRLAEPGVAAATVIANPFADPPGAAAAPWTHRDRRIAQFSPLFPAADFPQRLRARIDGTARRNLRKAQEAGITVAVENDAVAFLRACHRAGMAAIGGTPKPDAVFALLPQCFRPDRDFRLYVARLDGEPVAALLVLYYGRIAEYFIPATLAEHRALQPMAAILWRALCDAAAEGREVWNWGGTWESQTGVFRFKRKWGAEAAAYEYRITVRKPALLTQTPAALTAAYPYFYVAPFSALSPPGGTSRCST